VYTLFGPALCLTQQCSELWLHASVAVSIRVLWLEKLSYRRV
jgi:hypothetical protein